MRPFRGSSDRFRRGSATRGVLLSLASLLLLLVGLWWVMRTPSGAPLPTTAAPASTAVEEAQVELQDGKRQETGAQDLIETPGGLKVAVGVRLEGSGRLAGRVLDRANAQGVAAVRVALLPLPPSGSARLGWFLHLAGFEEEETRGVEAVATTLSAADGSFSFEGVRAGSYFVEARGAWHVPDLPVEARVAPSGKGGPIDVWVRRGGRIVGRVELPDGRPASGAGVSLRPGLEELVERVRNGELAFLDAQADESGSFVIPGVPEGEGWTVAAHGQGFALTHAGPLAVRAGEDTEVTIRAREGSALEGRVLSGGGAEGAPEPGTPVAGAHVGVVPRGLRDLQFVDQLLESCHDVTDSEGRFEVRHVPPGAVDLVGWAPGFLPSVGPELELAEGGHAVAPDFSLESGPRLDGRVNESAGAPVAGARVRWNPVDIQAFGFSFAPLLTQAVEGFAFPLTGADGRFQAGAFPGEPPFEITVTKAGYADASKSWRPGVSEEPFEIVLRRGGAVEGIVMDGTERKPVESFTVGSGAQIALRSDIPAGTNPFSGGHLFEDPQGRFRLEPLEPGKTRLHVSAPGYVPARTDELEIVEGETLRGVIVTLEPGGTVRGSVLDPSGQGVPGALVFWAADATAERPSGPAVERRGGARTPSASDLPPGLRQYAAALGLFGTGSVPSGPDGRFELAGVEPGRVLVYASHREFATAASSPVVVEAGRPVEGVVIELSQGGSLEGTVSDRFGRQVEGVIVVATAPGTMDERKNGADGVVYQGLSNAEGRYKIERMAGGAYFLTTARGGAALDPMSLLGTLNFELLTVPEGEEVEYDIVDTSLGGARVSGLVTDRGAPITGGRVLALGLESESLLGVDVKLARIRADGGYEFESLAPGEYQLQVTADLPARGDSGRAPEARVSVEIPDLSEVRLDLALPEGELSGAVRDAATGEGVKAAMVVLRALDQPAPSGMLGRLMAQGGRERASTDGDGRFSFERLEPGRWRLDVGAPSWGEQEGRYAPAEPLKLELREGERLDDLEVRLEPAIRVTGTVRDETGSPVSGASVVAVRSGLEAAAAQRAASDESGRFTLEGLAPGTWDLSASAEGFAQTTRRGVTVERDARGEVELVLARGIEVVLRVFDSAGRPVSGASGQLVALESSGAAFAGDAERLFGRLLSGEGTSGADGRLALGRFAPGRYRLEARRGFARAVPQEVELSGTERVELRVQLP